jgi:hypothetical protein
METHLDAEPDGNRKSKEDDEQGGEDKKPLTDS